MYLTLFVYAALGRICIFFLRRFPLTAKIIEKVLGHGFFCDLCLGTWVYTFWAFVLGINLFDTVFYIIGLSEFITGATMSLIMYLLVIGFRAEFTIVEVD